VIKEVSDNISRLYFALCALTAGLIEHSNYKSMNE